MGASVWCAQNLGPELSDLGGEGGLTVLGGLKCSLTLTRAAEKALRIKDLDQRPRHDPTSLLHSRDMKSDREEIPVRRESHRSPMELFCPTRSCLAHRVRLGVPAPATQIGAVVVPLSLEWFPAAAVLEAIPSLPTPADAPHQQQPQRLAEPVLLTGSKAGGM